MCSNLAGEDMWDNIKHKMAQWIPTHVSPRIVVFFYNVLSGLSIIRGSVRKTHRSENEAVLKAEESPLKNGFIDNQHEWKNVRFGRSDMAFSGCEIMAVYNVLYALGKGEGSAFVGDLIEEFEKSGAAIGGLIGSSPTSVRRHLKKHGIRSHIVWKEDDLDEDTDMAIVTLYNNKQTLYSQIHTIAFIREEQGFTVHNARSRQRYYPSLKEAVNGVGTNPKMICAVEIDSKSL